MSDKINILAGSVHSKTRHAIEDGYKIIIHKGGTGSGKTFDIMVLLLFYFAMSKEGYVITVVSESKPHLDIGAIRYSKLLISQSELFDLVAFNETRSFFTFPTGSIVEFFSADRIDKALGARRNVLYGNEINSLKESVWDELARRSDLVIGDFNPSSQFWLERWLSYYDHSIVINSNHLDNPYLNETERSKIIKRALIDTNFRRIHIDCEYGCSDALVFPDVALVDQVPDDGQHCYGLDFGYTNDPTALVEVRRVSDDLFVKQHIYRTGLLNRNIIELMEAVGIQRHYDEVFADSAEPKTIEEIRQAGFNIKPADKGRDSVLGGIQFINQHKLHVTKDSTDLIKELRNYTYITDSTGAVTNKPIDAFNHAIDALRYAVYTKFRPTAKTTAYIPQLKRTYKL